MSNETITNLTFANTFLMAAKKNGDGTFTIILPLKQIKGSQKVQVMPFYCENSVIIRVFGIKLIQK